MRLDGYIKGELFEEKYLLKTYEYGISVKVVQTKKNGDIKYNKDGKCKYGKPHYPIGGLAGCIEFIIRRECELKQQNNNITHKDLINKYEAIVESIKNVQEYASYITNKALKNIQ